MNSNYRKNLKDLATACKNYVDETKEQILWQVGQYNITTQDDNTTAYQKVVPTGATRAKIKSIGGMSYKSENLFDVSTIRYGYWDGGTSSTQNDYSTQYIQVQPSTTYYISGTIGSYHFLRCYDSSKTSISILINNTTTRTFTTPNNAYYIMYSANISRGNQPDTIMISKGSTAPTTYKQGFTGIRDSVITSVKSYGANLFDNANTTLVNSTFNNSNQTLFSYGGFALKVFNLTIGQTYTITSTKTMLLGETNDLTNSGTVSNGTSYTFTATTNYLLITNQTANQYEEIFNNLMLNVGSTAIPYKPYRGLIDTFTIPDEVKALEGYGRGINENCYNVLDLNTKEFTDKDNTLDIGALTYAKSASGLFQGMPPSDIKHPSVNTQIPNLLSAIYTPIASKDIYGPQSSTPSPNMVMALAVLDYLFFNNTDYTDISDFKTAMNGVNLQYELATYNTTNNLELPNNVIEVEEGGYLVFENQYGQAVPSNITYRIEVES